MNGTRSPGGHVAKLPGRCGAESHGGRLVGLADLDKLADRAIARVGHKKIAASIERQIRRGVELSPQGGSAIARITCNAGPSNQGYDARLDVKLPDGVRGRVRDEDVSASHPQRGPRERTWLRSVRMELPFDIPFADESISNTFPAASEAT